jgi:cobalt-zinc-cadmium resistance protein CzcA
MKFLVTAMLVMSTYPVFCQTVPLPIEKAVQEALSHNESIKAAGFELESQKQHRKSSFDLPKTDVMLMFGQYNSYAKNDNNITVSQSIPFSVFGTQQALNRSLVASSQLSMKVAENEIAYRVRQTYYELAFTLARHQLLLKEDSIYEGFLKSATLRYETGETNLLERATAEAQRSSARNKLRQSEGEIAQLQTQLKIIVNSPTLADLIPVDLTALEADHLFDTIGYAANPALAQMEQDIQVAENEKRLQSAKAAPDLTVGFFSQTLIGGPVDESGVIAAGNDRFTGFSVGISLPLWFAPHRARIRASEFDKLASESRYHNARSTLLGQMRRAVEELGVTRNSLEYYTTSALPNAALILSQSQIAYKEGEIGYAEYLLGIRNAINIRDEYLRTLNEFNQHVIYLDYLTGNP